MNPPLRRMTRLLSGIVAAGIVTTTVLAPVNAASAAPSPTADCVTLLGQLDAARADLRTAKVAVRSALSDTAAARTRVEAAPTTKHRKALGAARAIARDARAVRLTARDGYELAKTGYAPCLVGVPGVAVTNPRIAFYGSNFGIADITWSDIADGDYQLFMRYDDTPSYQGPVTFVDVVPQPLPFDPWDMPVFIRYLQNDVTYEGSYLGSGCDYTPGENVSVELWTSRDGTNPAGLQVAADTVDNPCR